MADIHFTSKLDADQVLKSLDQIEKELGTVGEAVQRESNRMETSFRRMGGLLATYLSFEGGKQLITELINVRGEFQQLDIAYQTILGSKAEADKLMAQTVEFAAKTPFELSDVAQGTKKLLAFNVEAEDTIETLRRLGDLSAGLGTDLDGLVQAYGKVKAKGKLQAEEMNLFLERGIPLVTELAEKYGVAESAIYDMASKSQIHFEDLHEVIVKMTDEGGMFANMMEKQAASLPGQVSNLKDAIAQMLNEIGESNEGILYDGIDVAKTLVENYEKVIAVLKSMVAAYGAYKTASIVTGIIRQAEALGSLTKALKGATVAQKALTLASKGNPMILAATAIIGVTTAIIGLTRAKKAALETDKDFSASITNQEAEMNSLFEIIKRSEKGSEERVSAIKTLNQTYGDYLPNLISEKDTLEELRSIQLEANKALLESISIKSQQEELQEATKIRLEAEKEIFNTILSSVASTQGDKIGRVAAAAWKDIYDQLTWYVTSETTDDFLRFTSTTNPNLANFANNYSLTMDEVAAATNNALIAYRDYQEAIKGITSFYGENKKDPGPGDAIDLKEFKNSIKAAKAAYKEWEQYKSTSRAKDLQEVYQQYLNLGDTYERYLLAKLEAAEGNKAAIALVWKELAALEVADSKLMEKFWGDVEKDNKKGAEEASDALEKWMNDWIDATEKKIQKEIEAEEAADSDKIQQAEKTAKAIQKIRERYAYESEYESRKAEYRKQLAELEAYHKAGYMLHKEYEESKAKVTREYLAEEIDLFQRGLAKVSASIVELFQEIDEQAAETMNNVAELIDDALGAIKSYYSKDIAGLISGIIGVASEIYQLVDDYMNQAETEALESQQQAYESINAELSLANVLLEERIKLLDTLNGTDWFLWLNTSLEDAQKEIDETFDLMTDLASGAFGRGDLPEGYTKTKTGIDTEGWTIDDYRQLILDATDFTEEQKEQMQGYIDKVVAYYDVQAQLLEDLHFKLTGTTSEAITDSIVEGLSNGQLYFEDFTDSFEDLMKQAIINSFETKYLEKQMDEWYQTFVDLAEDGVSNSDIDILRTQYAEMINNASTMWDAMTSSYGDLFDVGATDEDSNSLSGSIRRELTEETGTLLAGRMNTIMLDVREGLDIRKDMQNAVNGIEYNTYRIVERLNMIHGGIITLNHRLS